MSRGDNGDQARMYYYEENLRKIAQREAEALKEANAISGEKEDTTKESKSLRPTKSKTHTIRKHKKPLSKRFYAKTPGGKRRKRMTKKRNFRKTSG